MAGAGSAWIKPKTRSGLRPEALTLPHPRFLRAGQRFFPLRRAGSSRSTLRLIRPLADGTRWEALREDGAGARVTVSAARLLSLDTSGAASHYRFLGYASRSGYATHGQVTELDGGWALLICPEWHPRLPVRVAAAMIPAELRVVSAWLSCRADLGATKAAAVNPAKLGPPARDFAAERYHPPRPLREPAADEPAARPSTGPGCGDIVMHVDRELLAATASGARDDLCVIGHRPPVRAGARVYLCCDGRVEGWRPLRRARPYPNGTRLLLDDPFSAASVSVQVAQPAVGIAPDGSHGHQQWSWRSWERED